MKKIFSLILLAVALMAMTSSVFADSRENEVNDLLNWAESQGFEIEGDLSSLDYENINVDEVKNQLISISKLGKEVDFNEESSSFNLVETFTSKSNEIGTRSLDEKVVPMFVTKKYNGTNTVDGRRYKYTVYVYVDYNCLMSYNNEPLGIDKVNNITSGGKSASFIKRYDHDTGTEKATVSGSKATVRGQGTFKVGIDDLTLNWRVLWKTSFRAGEGDEI